MSPRDSAKRSGSIFHTHGRTLPTQPSTALGVTAGTTQLTRFTAPAASDPRKAKLGRRGVSRRHSPEDSREKTKSELKSAPVRRRCAVPSSVPPSAVRTGRPQVTAPGPTPRSPGTSG